MHKPFENLFGTTLELRILEFVLPLEGSVFNSVDLAEEFDISVEKASKIIRKLEKYDILMGIPDDAELCYTVNPESEILGYLIGIDKKIIEVG